MFIIPKAKRWTKAEYKYSEYAKKLQNRDNSVVSSIERRIKSIIDNRPIANPLNMEHRYRQVFSYRAGTHVSGWCHSLAYSMENDDYDESWLNGAWRNLFDQQKKLHDWDYENYKQEIEKQNQELVEHEEVYIGLVNGNELKAALKRMKKLCVNEKYGKWAKQKVVTITFNDGYLWIEPTSPIDPEFDLESVCILEYAHVFNGVSFNIPIKELTHTGKYPGHLDVGDIDKVVLKKFNDKLQLVIGNFKITFNIEL